VQCDDALASQLEFKHELFVIANNILIASAAWNAAMQHCQFHNLLFLNNYFILPGFV